MTILAFMMLPLSTTYIGETRNVRSHLRMVKGYSCSHGYINGANLVILCEVASNLTAYIAPLLGYYKNNSYCAI